MARTTITTASDINTVLRALGVESTRNHGDRNPDELDDVVAAAKRLATLANDTLYAGLAPDDVEPSRGRISAAWLAGARVRRGRR